MVGMGPIELQLVRKMWWSMWDGYQVLQDGGDWTCCLLVGN